MLGIVELCQRAPGKGMATAGLLPGIASGTVQLIVDLVLSVFTMGLCFFI
ncbi:MAG: hypothetical protein PHD32_01395 [Eubacteriales bacterium]|nr:hypothetical protein [Eubacteriales bacterium]